MTWVAWRQQRLQLLLSLATVVVVTGVLVYFRIDGLAYASAPGRSASGCSDPSGDSSRTVNDQVIRSAHQF